MTLRRTTGQVQRGPVPRGEAARDSLGLDGFYARNYLINGDFKVAQRGTTFTAATTPANDDDTWLLDRWLLLSDGDDIVDVSQNTTAANLPAGAYAAATLDVETANKKFGLAQIIESRSTARLFNGGSGRVSLSFKAKVTVGVTISALRAGVLAWDDAADTVTSDIVNAWNAAGANPTPAANWTFENTPATLATLTSSWQTFSIEDIVLDTAGTTNLAVFIWTDDVTMDVGDILWITDIQLQNGPIATDYAPREFSADLAMCQRFYCKSFNYATTPAQSAGFDGVITYRTPAAGAAADQTIYVQYPVEMFKTPTVTFYNPNGANSNWRNKTGGADSGASAVEANTGGTTGFGAHNAAAAGDLAWEVIAVHYSAEGEM